MTEAENCPINILLYNINIIFTHVNKQASKLCKMD